MDAEEALSKLAHVASNGHAASNRRPARAGSDFSAGPRVTEPSLGPALRAADMTNDPSPGVPPSLGRQTSRRLVRFLMAACFGVAATLAWQSYGDAAREMIATSAPQLGWLLLPPPAMDPPPGREIAGEQPGPSALAASAPQAPSAQAAGVASTASEAAASTAAAEPSPELRQQLETMAHDLAAVRQRVEQLAAGQEQIAGDLAKLHTAEQDIRRRISALPPAAGATVRKPVPLPQVPPQSSVAPPPPPPPQVAPQSSIAPAPPPPPQVAPQSSAAPLPPLPPAPPEPPRPPMPVR